MTLQQVQWKSHFPYPTIRPVQEQLLTQLTEQWNTYDVFIVSLPTASGKSSIAKTLLNLHINAAYLTPTNQLLEQFLDQHPTSTLHRLDSYYCSTWRQPSSVTRGKLGRLCSEAKGEVCPGCKQLGRDLSSAKYKQGPIAINYHTYLAHKLQREVVIIDEAQNIAAIIKDKLSTKLWQHDYHYPSNAWNYPQLIKWIEGLPDSKRRGSKLSKLYSNLISANPEFVASRAMEDFNGKGTKRGEPEERDCLKLVPVDISQAPLYFLPQGTRKLVLMSATLSRKDVEALGLERFSKRICYIECKSPIPVTSRPFIPLGIQAVTKLTMESSEELGKLASEIDNIVNQHIGERGLIHATYPLAQLLRKHLSSNPRYLFHTRESKQQVYEQFLSDTTDRVLIASGMYEGVDLPGDLGRFQVIAKVPWPNLGDPAIEHLCKRDPELYTWLTLRTLIQAYGRICRTPEDFGVTICLDSTFSRLISDATRLNLVPGWFREAVITP